MRIAFRFRPIAFVVTVLLVALGISLGQWQDRRAAGKLALAAQRSAQARQAPQPLGAAPLTGEGLEFRRVRVRGSFVAGWPVYLDNRPYQGRAGFYLTMPMRIAGSDMHVLVVRAWLPRDAAARERVPAYLTPPGELTIEGELRRDIGHVMQLGTPAPLVPGAIVQNLTPDALARASGLTLQPWVLFQSGPNEDGLARDWPAPALGVEKHQGYAFQWYALATMAFLFFVMTGFRRGTKQSQ